MKKINLVTTNERKVKEANAALAKYSIEVKQIKFDIAEIQSADPLEILKTKAETAFEKLRKPVVVTDTSWNIPSLNGFPGSFMKYIAEWFEPEDFLKLVEDKGDRRVAFTESIAYKDEVKVKTFSKEYWGQFAEIPKGRGNSIERIAEFNGLTIGERKDRGELNHNPEDYIWTDFAKWYK